MMGHALSWPHIIIGRIRMHPSKFSFQKPVLRHMSHEAENR
jgi:hypothetical protein